MYPEKYFFHILDKLDVLMKSRNTNALKEFIELTKYSDIVLNYAFTQLDRFDWIGTMKELGCFSNPPYLTTNAEGNIISHNWPQADFLKRMAQKDSLDVQQQVLEIMLEAGGTDDSYIHRCFTEAALSMPGYMAAKWAQHESQWLHDDNKIYGIPEREFGLLISKLAKEGEPDVAVELASELLIIMPGTQDKEMISDDGDSERLFSRHPKPRIRLRRYNYDKILKKSIPHLCKSAPFKTLEMLCTLLENFIKYSLNNVDKQKPNDLSYIGRPAIEDHRQNQDSEIKGTLITAIRDVTIDICRSDQSQISKVIEVIENHEWNVFKRISLHLLRVIEDAPLHVIELNLINKAYFDSVWIHYEYYHLLKKYFSRLSSAGQNQILMWIDQAKEFKELIENDHELTEGQRKSRLNRWRYGKLYSIQGYLTGEWKERFLRLKEEFGEPDIPFDFSTWRESGWIGPKSPKNAGELSEMSMDELIDYLKNWKPSGDWMAPTPDGLGSILGSLVAEHPDKYTAEIQRFMDKNMDPTYVRHLISGFCQAIEKGMLLPYELVFKVCKWVVDQPKKTPNRKLPGGLRDDFEVDVDWQNTRQEIARLFEKIFDDKLKLPYDLHRKAWCIIEVLTNDPDPDLEYEEKYGGKNSDPLHLSINTIRGKALHGVIHYALWMCRQIKDDLMQKEHRAPSFQDIPEVRTVLDNHLDIRNFPFASNQTDRAVYGQWLPQLIHVDKQWVQSNIEKLFPREQEHKHLREALWNTYLLYSGLYTPVYDAIKNIYRMEVENLVNMVTIEDSQERTKTRLVEHIVILYAWGKITLASDDLISLFFQIAPPQLTGHAIDFIGRGLAGNDKPEKAIVDLYKTLWDWRVDKAGGTEKISDIELAAFGWWFASGLCGDEWALPYLEKTLERTDIEYSKDDVFEHLSTIFMTYPGQSLRCLRLFIDKNKDPWFFDTQREGGVWKILEQGITHKDSTVNSAAQDITHLLGSKGYLQYRELLAKPL